MADDDRRAQIDVDVLTHLLAYCAAVIRHTETLTDDAHAELAAVVELGWMAVRDAERE